MFHITFVQIGVFDWLSGRQKGSIFIKMFKNLLLRNHMEDEAKTWHTFEGHYPLQKLRFLAHLSQRLIGELIGYSWSGVRPSSSDVRPSVVNNFKRLLRQNCLPDQCQFLCGASLGRGNESSFAASGSHDQDGRHAHIW